MPRSRPILRPRPPNPLLIRSPRPRPIKILRSFPSRHPRRSTLASNAHDLAIDVGNILVFAFFVCLRALEREVPRVCVRDGEVEARCSLAFGLYIFRVCWVDWILLLFRGVGIDGLVSILCLVALLL